MKTLVAIRLPALALVAALTALVASCNGDDGGSTGPDTGQVEVAVTADGATEGGVSLSFFAAGASSPSATATTAADGTATFTDVEPGSYEVEVDPPAGLTLAEGESARKSVTVTAGETTQVDFALTEEDGGEVVEITLTSSLTFSPDQVTISPGTTVRWVNGASIFHTITPDGHSEWTRATMSQTGETFEHTFDEAGTFPYFCEPHQSQGMTGVITVQ